MDSVARYMDKQGEFQADMWEHDEGKYVLYSDHKEIVDDLREQLADALRDNQRLELDNRCFDEEIEQLRNEYVELENEIIDLKTPKETT